MTRQLKIEFITSASFWRQGCGLWARTHEMVRFLSTQGTLRVTYLGDLPEQALQEIDFPIEVRNLYLGVAPSAETLLDICRRAMDETPLADLYIVNKTENSFILDALPAGARAWVDTHDLVSERTRKLEAEVAKERFPLNASEEAQLLDRYELVICIQRQEYQHVCTWLGSDKVVCVPHPVAVTPRALQNPPTRIGLVASDWHANAYGLADFLRSAWPVVRRSGASLEVYGSVDRVIRAKVPAVTFHGFTENLDDCYSNIDIVINPVTYGAGLKIKSVEALANGLPLVTTREGASGLEELDGQALHIAKDWDHFASLLAELVQDYQRCLTMGRKGAEYARRQLNREVCLAPLRKKLEELRSSLS